MNTKEIGKVKCPYCGKEGNFTFWKVINTSLEPALKAGVRDGSAFLFHCPHCGEETYVDYSLLYHQPEDKILINCADTDRGENEVNRILAGAKADPMLAGIDQSAYLTRMVASRSELMEKLAIFDAGLDDRLIELCKLIGAAQYMKDRPDNSSVTVQFFLSKDGQKCLRLFEDDAHASTMVLHDELYQQVRRTFASGLPSMRSDIPVIDQNWAVQVMKLLD
ncbi:MAG: CpXC domain-containing protein [Eubacteriales bacterium]|nr:CpXC domain-containing protein [Eubacteriales bacterium]